jgi:Response regulator containing a CheY-like receiver domain and an HTH DNA-binding domain
MPRLINVLLVEEQAIVRQAIGELLGRQPGLRIVASVSSVEAALNTLCGGPTVDVIVTDVMREDEIGDLDLLSTLREHDIHAPVLYLSSYSEPWLYTAALRGGALGYVLRGASLDAVVSAIVSVAAGVAVFPAASLRDRIGQRDPSTREREIMRLIADGYGNGEIGARLGIKEKTVESHLTRLFARYSLGSRTELAMLASRRGWIRRASVGVR